MRPALLLILIGLLAIVPETTSQPLSAPSIPAAEQAFDRGLRAFRAEQFTAAHVDFMRTATGYEYNQRTTAAHLMAGQALLAAGDFDEAASLMTRFVAEYPRSRYVDAAREIRRQATAAQRERVPPPAVTTLGILLPRGPDDATFSQALFNGIRLAVDDHNAANPDRPVRMVFRESGGQANPAADAVRSLARDGAHVVIGPLYSSEATAAAEAAEREGVVLIAPMATDEAVARGRRFIFQANPTFAARARAMARYAVANGLLEVGIITEEGSIGEEKAEAFRDELERRGGTVLFERILPGAEAWFQLSERIDAAALREVDALYLPMSGADAHAHAAAALRGLEQLLGPDDRRPQILGNQEWQNLRTAHDLATQYRTVFTNDYWLGPETPALRTFTNRYYDLAGVIPDRLAFKGYDVTRMVLTALAGGAERTQLTDRLRAASPHQGLGHRIDFGDGQVNQHVFLLEFLDREIVPVRR